MIRIRTTDEIVIHDGLDVTMENGKITISRADEGTSVQAYQTSLQAQVDAQESRQSVSASSYCEFENQLARQNQQSRKAQGNGRQ